MSRALLAGTCLASLRRLNVGDAGRLSCDRRRLATFAFMLTGEPKVKGSHGSHRAGRIGYIRLRKQRTVDTGRTAVLPEAHSETRTDLDQSG